MTPAEKINLKNKLLQAVNIIVSLEERITDIENYIVAQNEQYNKITDALQKQLLTIKSVSKHE